MKATIHISGVIGEETTLVDVIRQFKSYKDVTEIDTIIRSVGGNVEEGEAIYKYLKGLDSEIPVTTITDKAYSIAAQIFAAGSTRIIEDTDKALMIHFAWADKISGNAERFEAVAGKLREIEDRFASFYASFLNVDNDTVRNLLDNDTFVTGAEAVDLGFATEIKTALKAVAEYSIKHSKIEKMDKKRSLSKKLMDAMAAFIDGVEINAALVLQDSNAIEIEFPDLEEGGMPSVGDKATIDSKTIEDGSYIMPSLEEVTLVFVDGAITEVIEKVVESAEEIEARLKADKIKADIKAEEVQQINVWTMEVINTTFAEGDTVKYVDYDGNEVTIGSGEFQLNDGRRIITDATGVIVSIKEADAKKVIEVDAETDPKPEASFDKLLEKVTVKVTESVKAELEASFKSELSEKDNEILKLKKQIGSKEINAQKKELEDNATPRKKTLAEVLQTKKQ